MKIEESILKIEYNGRKIKKFTVSNRNGISVSIIDFGATLVSVRTPDRKGKINDIIIAFDNLEDYFINEPYLGATVGRFANRIANGRFSIQGNEYVLKQNLGKHHLHGGEKGFHKIVWDASIFEQEDSAGVRFSYTSPDGEEGYPGNLEVHATYRLTESDDLSFEYEAVTDKATPVNLTNHAYWNLAAAGNSNINKHELIIHADQYLDVDELLIPTGKLVNVLGTLFDFTKRKPIGRDIAEIGGYDHCFVLKKTCMEPALTAEVYEPESGRIMKVYTTQPGIQFYTDNFENGINGIDGKVLVQHAAFCLETQRYPDSVNHDNFPKAILNPGEAYKEITRHNFSHF